MANNLLYGRIVIEATRRCNMVCPHCMRGDAQNIDADFNMIDTFLKNFKDSYVHTIFFTGGEPSLVPEVIDYTLSKALSYSINFTYSGIVINGKCISAKFIDVINKWSDLCDFDVQVSSDNYHSKLLSDDYMRLSSITNVSSKAGIYYDRFPLNLGYARENNIGTGELGRRDLMYTVYKNKNIVTSPTVLTCKGDILSSCDYEYTDTDRFKICNYNDDLEFFVRSKGVYVDLEHCGVATYIYRWFDHIRKNGGNI